VHARLCFSVPPCLLLGRFDQRAFLPAICTIGPKDWAFCSPSASLLISLPLLSPNPQTGFSGVAPFLRNGLGSGHGPRTSFFSRARFLFPNLWGFMPGGLFFFSRSWGARQDGAFQVGEVACGGREITRVHTCVLDCFGDTE
jgi:hypothetical protein